MAASERPVTVLFAHYGKDWIRGSEQCLLDLVRHIDRARFHPVVLCNHDTVAQAVTAAGAVGTVIPEVGPAAVAASRWQVRGLQQAAEKYGARIMHANTSGLVPALMRVARSLRIPLVAHLHITPTALERRHELLHQASLVVGVSERAVEGFIEEGMDPRRVRVIYNAVDMPRISTGDATGLRRELGIGTHTCVAVTLGSLIERKGHDIAIRAMATVRAAGADVQLLVCGSGEEEHALRALAQTLGVSDIVHFLGFRTDAGAILRDAADVCIAPSRWEALPLNLLEAQCLGLPVIASDIPAHHEALVNPRASVIVPLDNPEALAAAVVAFTRDAERPLIAQQVARPVALEQFSMHRYVSDFERAYSELLREPRNSYGWLAATRWPRVYTTWARDLLARRVGAIAREPRGTSLQAPKP